MVQVGSVKVYDLYYSELDSTYSFFERKNSKDQLMPKDSRFIWSVQAMSFEIANLKKHEFLGWEPYKPMIVSENELKNYLPLNKIDIDNAQLLVNLGYPNIKSILFEILTWLQDMNWPVAKIFAPFLATIGRELKDGVRVIFRTQDAVWKYWIIHSVLNDMLDSELQFFREDLEELSLSTDAKNIVEGVPEMARELLARLENKKQ